MSYIIMSHLVSFTFVKVDHFQTFVAIITWSYLTLMWLRSVGKTTREWVGIKLLRGEIRLTTLQDCYQKKTQFYTK